MPQHIPFFPGNHTNPINLCLKTIEHMTKLNPLVASETKQIDIVIVVSLAERSWKKEFEEISWILAFFIRKKFLSSKMNDVVS